VKRDFLKKWVLDFAKVFAGLWIPFEVYIAFSSDETRPQSFFIVALVLGLVATLLNTQRYLKGFKVYFEDLNLTVSVRRGDALEANQALVVSFSDTFDTERSKTLISKTSFQSKFTDSFYSGDEAQLNRAIEDALKQQKVKPQSVDKAKKNGKNKRYELA